MKEVLNYYCGSLLSSYKSLKDLFSVTEILSLHGFITTLATTLTRARLYCILYEYLYICVCAHFTQKKKTTIIQFNNNMCTNVGRFMCTFRRERYYRRCINGVF